MIKDSKKERQKLIQSFYKDELTLSQVFERLISFLYAEGEDYADLHKIKYDYYIGDKYYSDIKDNDKYGLYIIENGPGSTKEYPPFVKTEFTEEEKKIRNEIYSKHSEEDDDIPLFLELSANKVINKHEYNEYIRIVNSRQERKLKDKDKTKILKFEKEKDEE